MTGAGNICHGHCVSGKALCSQMSNGSVSVWTTAELKCCDVKAITQIVVYRSVHIVAAGVWWCGAVYRGATGTSCGY